MYLAIPVPKNDKQYLCVKAVLKFHPGIAFIFT